MRDCFILINNDNSVEISPTNQYIGEHAATRLVITLNDELCTEDISCYTLSFGIGCDATNPYKIRIRSDSVADIPEYGRIDNGIIYFTLPNALTLFSTLDIQVEAYSTDKEGNITKTVKSPVFEIHFNKSIEGEDYIRCLHEAADSLSHAHGNKKTLDGFYCQSLETGIEQDASSSDLKWNGASLRFAGEGAVVSRVEPTVNEEGKPVFRLWLDWGNSQFVVNKRYIDIPVEEVKDTVIENGDVILNGSELSFTMGTGGTGLTEEQAADLAANTEARHEHENKDTLDRFGNLIQSDYPFPTGDDTPTYNGTGLWTTEHGQVIADVSKDKETGDLTFELRRLPLFDDETDTVYIKQHFKTSELENDKKFITADDLPEVNNVTPEQTTFFDSEVIPTSNLLDISTMQVGMLEHTTGKLYTGGSYDNYVYFDQYIPVSKGDVLTWHFSDSYTRRWSWEYGNFDFNRIVAYDENKNILSALGALNQKKYYIVPDTVAFIKITTEKQYITRFTEIMLTKNATELMPYEEYGEIKKYYLSPEYIPEKKNTILAFMPDEIVCATGRTIEIYNNQVCPLAEKYHFRWVCDIGKALKRKFSITGTEELIGDYDLILEIYDDTETCLYSKTSTLKIVTGTITDNVSICPIGDSLTNGKYWLNEVRTLSDNKVSYVGTRGNTEGVKHEGRSGFTSKGYLTAQDYDFENEGVHPFWDGTKFSWEYYKTNSGINPSAVQIFLGTNDLFGQTTAETFSTNIKTMVDDIRSADTNIPIFVVMTILTGNQNGLGKQQSTDGFAAYKGKYKYSLDCKFIKAMNLLYDTLKDYSNLYFVPLTECHDNEYNFGEVETPVNPRASQKEYIPNEGIHPQQQGYEQMADIMYSVYCRAFLS